MKRSLREGAADWCFISAQKSIVFLELIQHLFNDFGMSHEIVAPKSISLFFFLRIHLLFVTVSVERKFFYQ